VLWFVIISIPPLSSLLTLKWKKTSGVMICYYFNSSSFKPFDFEMEENFRSYNL